VDSRLPDHQKTVVEAPLVANEALLTIGRTLRDAYGTHLPQNPFDRYLLPEIIEWLVEQAEPKFTVVVLAE
jgi:hypothetical protein